MAKKKPVTEVTEVTEGKNLPFVDKNNNGINDADEYPNSAEEDSYLSQSELTPNARFVSEVLNDLLYKIHRNRLSQNEVNKLRTQIENSVTVR